MISHHISAQIANERQRDFLRSAAGPRLVGRRASVAVAPDVANGAVERPEWAELRPASTVAQTLDGQSRLRALPAVRRSPSADSHPRERQHVG